MDPPIIGTSQKIGGQPSEHRPSSVHPPKTNPTLTRTIKYAPKTGLHGRYLQHRTGIFRSISIALVPASLIILPLFIPTLVLFIKGRLSSRNVNKLRSQVNDLSKDLGLKTDKEKKAFLTKLKRIDSKSHQRYEIYYRLIKKSNLPEDKKIELENKLAEAYFSSTNTSIFDMSSDTIELRRVDDVYKQDFLPHFYEANLTNLKEKSESILDNLGVNLEIDLEAKEMDTEQYRSQRESISEAVIRSALTHVSNDDELDERDKNLLRGCLENEQLSHEQRLELAEVYATWIGTGEGQKNHFSEDFRKKLEELANQANLRTGTAMLEHLHKSVKREIRIESSTAQTTSNSGAELPISMKLLGNNSNLISDQLKEELGSKKSKNEQRFYLFSELIKSNFEDPDLFPLRLKLQIAYANARNSTGTDKVLDEIYERDFFPSFMNGLIFKNHLDIRLDCISQVLADEERHSLHEIERKKLSCIEAEKVLSEIAVKAALNHITQHNPEGGEILTKLLQEEGLHTGQKLALAELYFLISKGGLENFDKIQLYIYSIVTSLIRHTQNAEVKNFLHSLIEQATEVQTAFRIQGESVKSRKVKQDGTFKQVESEIEKLDKLFPGLPSSVKNTLLITIKDYDSELQKKMIYEKYIKSSSLSKEDQKALEKKLGKITKPKQGDMTASDAKDHDLSSILEQDFLPSFNNALKGNFQERWANISELYDEEERSVWVTHNCVKAEKKLAKYTVETALNYLEQVSKIDDKSKKALESLLEDPTLNSGLKLTLAEFYLASEHIEGVTFNFNSADREVFRILQARSENTQKQKDVLDKIFNV